MGWGLSRKYSWYHKGILVIQAERLKRVDGVKEGEPHCSAVLKCKLVENMQ